MGSRVPVQECPGQLRPQPGPTPQGCAGPWRGRGGSSPVPWTQQRRGRYRVPRGGRTGAAAMLQTLPTARPAAQRQPMSAGSGAALGWDWSALLQCSACQGAAALSPSAPGRAAVAHGEAGAGAAWVRGGSAPHQAWAVRPVGPRAALSGDPPMLSPGLGSMLRRVAAGAGQGCWGMAPETPSPRPQGRSSRPLHEPPSEGE